MPGKRLLLVDDNPAMLQTLVEMLQRDFSIVGTFSSGAAALAEATNLKPDIILLDISLGDMTGIYVAKHLISVGCQARIVFLSVHESADFVRAALDSGASGYVFKSRISSDLLNALEAVSQGSRFDSLTSGVSKQ